MGMQADHIGQVEQVHTDCIDIVWHSSVSVDKQLTEVNAGIGAEVSGRRVLKYCHGRST